MSSLCSDHTIHVAYITLHVEASRKCPIHTGPAEPAKIKYEAESPDEAALVAAGKVFGFFFYKRTNTTVFVRETEGAQQQETEYEILNILEFDSTRKRMSIICRTPEGKLKLYCKVSAHSAISHQHRHISSFTATLCQRSALANLIANTTLFTIGL